MPLMVHACSFKLQMVLCGAMKGRAAQCSACNAIAWNGMHRNLRIMLLAQVYTLPGLELLVCQELQDGLTFPWAWKPEQAQVIRAAAVAQDGQLAMVITFHIPSWSSLQLVYNVTCCNVQHDMMSPSSLAFYKGCRTRHGAIKLPGRCEKRECSISKLADVECKCDAVSRAQLTQKPFTALWSMCIFTMIFALRLECFMGYRPSSPQRINT